MSTDARCSFTITEIRKDDPRLKEFDELPEDEKQVTFRVEYWLSVVLNLAGLAWLIDQ